MRQTCAIVNFDNLHLLFGLLGTCSLVFEQMESSDWCWFVVKKISFSERFKGVINRMFMQTAKSTSRVNIVQCEAMVQCTQRAAT